MLNGIGGRTVEEAKQRITYAEFQDWVTYKQMRGSLNTNNRLESGFALIASLISKVAGGKAEPIDFMPHADKPEANIDDVLKEFGGFKRG